MAKNYETLPVLRVNSARDLSLIAGGGMFGFAAVVVHEPTDVDFHEIKNVPEAESTGPLGMRFNYDIVSTVTVSGVLRWTNSILERAPKGRQDVRETGRIALDLFDVEECREFLESHARSLDLLGLTVAD